MPFADLKRSFTPHYLLALGMGAGVAAAYYILLRGVGPFGDEGSYCTIAQGIVDGYAPYLDYFNEKPPLHYYWTAFVFSLFGATMDSSRLAASLQLGGALALVLMPLAERRHGWRILYWALLIGAAGLSMRAYNNLAESSLALLGVIGLRFALRARAAKATQHGLWAGLSQGLSCGFRLTAALNVLVLAWAPWSWRARASYFAGVVLALSIWVGMLAVNHLVEPFLESTVLFHKDNPASGSYFRGILPQELTGILIWVLVIAVAGYSAIKRRQVWVLVYLLGAALPFFGRMDAFRLWPSTLVGLSYLVAQTNLGPTRWLGWTVGWVSVLVLMIATRPVEGYSRARAIADAVSGLTQPHERVWVVPFNPNVYCLSNRRPASRYYFVLPWTLKPDVRREIMHDLRARPPRVVVEGSWGKSMLPRLFPEVLPWLQANYVEVAREGEETVLLRNTPDDEERFPR